MCFCPRNPSVFPLPKVSGLIHSAVVLPVFPVAITLSMLPVESGVSQHARGIKFILNSGGLCAFITGLHRVATEALPKEARALSLVFHCKPQHYLDLLEDLMR